MQFLHLCEDVILPVLTEWLDIEDLGIVDTSFCSLSNRQQFLKIISLETFVVVSKKQIVSNAYLKWLSMRSIRVRDLFLSKILNDGDDTDQTVLDCVYNITNNSKEFRKLSLSCSINTLAFMSSFKGKVQSLDLSGSFSPQDILNILGHHAGLKELTLDVDNDLADIDYLNITTLCPNLKVFDTSKRMKVAMSRNAKFIIAYGCPNLTSIQFYSQPMSEITEILRVCHNLTSVRIDEVLFAVDQYTSSEFTDLLAARAIQLKQLTLKPGFNSHPMYLKLLSIMHMFVNLTDLAFNAGVTDELLLIVAKHCIHIQNIDFSYGSITDAGMCAIAENLHDLCKIDISYCDWIGDKSVHSIAKNCPNLVIIKLFGCRQVTDETLAELFRKCLYLEKIYATDTDAPDNGVMLTEIVKDCKSLYLNATQMISRQWTKAYEKRLLTARVYTVQSLSNSSIASILLQSAPQLEHFSLNGYKDLTLVELSHMLASCPHLISLVVNNCPAITSAEEVSTMFNEIQCFSLQKFTLNGHCYYSYRPEV